MSLKPCRKPLFSCRTQVYLEKVAVASEAIALGQSGRIYLDNPWRRARCRQFLDLPVGTSVRVKSREQLTLWVEPGSG